MKTDMCLSHSYMLKVDFAFLFNCTPAGRTSDLVMVLTKRLIYWWDGRGLVLWLFVGPTWVYLLDFFCSGNQFYSLLSPYLWFISLLYEGCSNMNASSFITFFTFMLRQNVIPFWKELFVAFKMTPNIKKRSLYFSSYRCLYKGHSCILKLFWSKLPYTSW